MSQMCGGGDTVTTNCKAPMAMDQVTSPVIVIRINQIN